VGAEQLREGQERFSYHSLLEPETRLEAGGTLLEKVVQESDVVAENQVADNLFYQIRALKAGPIFSILVREDRETLADPSFPEFPLVIIPGGARVLMEDVWVQAVRKHGVEKVIDVVTRLPLYGFEGRPYRLDREGFISPQICRSSLNACFWLKNGLLSFELRCDGVTSPYSTYHWAVNQEGAVLNEEVRVHLGHLDMAEAVFRPDKNGIFRIQASESSLVNSFTREDLGRAFDLFNLEASDFLFSEQARGREEPEESLTSLSPEWRFLLSSGALTSEPEALPLEQFDYTLSYNNDLGGKGNLTLLNTEMAREEGLDVEAWKLLEGLDEAVAAVILFVDRQAVLEKGRLVPDDFSVCLAEKGVLGFSPDHLAVLTGHIKANNSQGEKIYGDVILNTAFQVVSGGGESKISLREVQKSDIHLAAPFINLASPKPCLLHVCALVLDSSREKNLAFVGEGLEEGLYVEPAMSSVLGLPVDITSGSRIAVRQAIKGVLARPEEFGFSRKLIAAR
jgi:hypothetical protein